MFRNEVSILNIEKALNLVKKLAKPNNVEKVSIDSTGDVVMTDVDGNSVGDYIYKELEAVKFKEEHFSAPRKWRSWAAKKKKEF